MSLNPRYSFYVYFAFVLVGLWTSCHSVRNEHALFLNGPSQTHSMEVLDLDSSASIIYQPVVIHRKNAIDLFAILRNSPDTSAAIFHAIGDGKKFFYKGVLSEGGFKDQHEETCSIIGDPTGDFVMTYLSVKDGKKQLMIATSSDLTSWKTRGPAFGDSGVCTMGGVIVGSYMDGEFLAKEINNQYWMIWGGEAIHLATSTDLLTWTPLRTPSGALHILFGPGHEGFDAARLMIGPPPIWYEEGILMLYHGVSLRSPSTAEFIRPGQIVLDPVDPRIVLARSPSPVLDQEVASRVIQVQSINWDHGSTTLYAGTENKQLVEITFSTDL